MTTTATSYDKYNIIQNFTSEFELTEHISSLPSYVIQRTNKTTCTICDERSHQMKVQFTICKNTSCITGEHKLKECRARYKIEMCLKENNKESRISKSNEHNSQEIATNKPYGIPQNIKDLIDQMIIEKVDMPKRLALFFLLEIL